MPTFYKPTERRGKRVVYRSTDPNELKRETIAGVVMLVSFVLMAALLWFSSR